MFLMNTQNHSVIQPLLTQGASQKGLMGQTAVAAHSCEAFVAGIKRITLITSEIILFMHMTFL